MVSILRPLVETQLQAAVRTAMFPSQSQCSGPAETLDPARSEPGWAESVVRLRRAVAALSDADRLLVHSWALAVDSESVRKTDATAAQQTADVTGDLRLQRLIRDLAAWLDASDEDRIEWYGS